MPMLGLTMEEGTVAEWLKQEGDSVRRDEPLLTVEMDKGTMEVPAPASGVVSRILVPVGTTVAVKTPIAEIETAAGSTSATVPAAPAAPPPSVAVSSPQFTPATAAPVPAASAVTSNGGSGGRAFSSPRARMRARELGVDLAQVRGSGPHGRIVEADVMAASAPSIAQERVLATPLARRLAQEHGVDIAALQGTGPGGRVTQEDVLGAAAQAGVEQLSRMRRITAER